MSNSKKNVKTIEKESEMQKLLEKAESVLVIPKVGDAIEGTIFEIGSNAIYIDLGQFGTGVVRGEELQSGLASKEFKVGDKVSAIINELDNEESMMELSFKQASLERAWEDIQEKMEKREVISVKILFANKGGLMVEVNGIAGFLPVSQLSPEHYPKVEDSDKNKILSKLRDFIGKNISVRIIDIDFEAKKLIVSEKAIQDEERKSVLSGFASGDIIEGTVSGVVDFGAFIKFAPKGKDVDSIEEDKKLEGLVHISELAWQLIENPRDVIKEGDKVKAKIISIEDGGRVSLSIKNLQEDPWTKIGEKYEIGKKVSGKVSKVNHFGAFIDLDKDIHGLVHISELSKQKEKIEVGNTYEFEIISMDPAVHKMGLKLYKEGEAKEAKSSKKAEKVEAKESLEEEEK